MEENTLFDGANSKKLVGNKNQDGQVEMTFAADNPNQIQYTPQTWYQKNLDVVFPLVIIGIGLFQYVLRKWILPVDKDIIFELEDQLPSQGIIFHPGFGAFIMIAGLIMLVLFNLDHIFSF